jgi:hypothetical protein
MAYSDYWCFVSDSKFYSSLHCFTLHLIYRIIGASLLILKQTQPLVLTIAVILNPLVPCFKCFPTIVALVHPCATCTEVFLGNIFLIYLLSVTLALFSSQKILQNFSDSPSHRIFRHMHEVLNIDKNKN